MGFKKFCKKGTFAKRILSIFLVVVMVFSMNFGTIQKGTIVNAAELSNIKGKTIFFLGSSVTYGSASGGVSFADYIARRNNCTSVKEAVSGTTLVDNGSSSYIQRMKKNFDKSARPDHFICQLSTNDASQNQPLGSVSSSYNINDFNTSTVIGAMEYIIAYAKNTWNCPVAFYTGTYYNSSNYQKMVDALLKLKHKWNIGVIDLWNDQSMRNVSASDRSKYMADDIHPTALGYEEWWTPKFEEYLQNYDYNIYKNSSGTKVYIYHDINYSGTSTSLEVGNYNLDALRSKGFSNDALTSIKCPFGYRVTLYSNDNFSGDMKIITSDTSTVGAEWNDIVSSIKVEKARYRVINRHSGLCLDVNAGSTANDANVQQWTQNGTGAQTWEVSYNADDSTYVLINPNSGKALDIKGWSTDNGGNALMWNNSNTNNQRWYITFIDNGYTFLINKHSNKALDAAEWSTVSGGNVHQWDYFAQANQQWKFELIY